MILHCYNYYRIIILDQNALETIIIYIEEPAEWQE